MNLKKNLSLAGLNIDKGFLADCIEKKYRVGMVELIEEKPVLAFAEISGLHPKQRIFICDVYVDGMEKGTLKDGVLKCGNITSVDHHAPLEFFSRMVSSTNLAIGYVKMRGPVFEEAAVVISHTDYDSLFSALILRGVFPPGEDLGKLAIAADHTGERNEIVDLAQALNSEHDLEFSLRNLRLLLKGEPLDPAAQKLLRGLADERRRAEETIRKGEFKREGFVVYAKLGKKIDSSFFPALMPDAPVILLYSPHRKYAGYYEAKIRLGLSAPAGLRLNSLGINVIDSLWGGRWNAGSNKRGRGTNLPIKKYACLLNGRIEEFLEKEAK